MKATISEQLNDLLNPKPREEYNPEDEDVDAAIREHAKKDEFGEIEPVGQRRIFPELPLDPKFAARKTTRKELEEHGEEDESGSEEEESSEDKEDAAHFSDKEGATEKNDEHEPEEEVDAALKEIQEEDTKHAEQVETVLEATEAEKGRQVIAQRKVMDCLIGLRILLEKVLTNANRLPQPGTISHFKENPDVKLKYGETIEKVKKLILTTLRVQTKLGLGEDLTEGSESDDMPALWTKIMKNKTACKDKVYDVIENWMEKTQLYVNAKLKQNMKVLGAHPLRQVEDKYSKNKSKLLQKAQQKSKAFRVLGNPSASIQEMRDKEIYEDAEYYQTFLRDYLSLNTRPAGEASEEGFDWTYKYLQSRGITKREKLGAPLIQSKKRKNKALKYVVHEKLVNFMPQQENPNLLPGYENIVKKLFGVRAKEDQEEPEKTRKRVGTDELALEMERINTKTAEGMDVALI